MVSDKKLYDSNGNILFREKSCENTSYSKKTGRALKTLGALALTAYLPACASESPTAVTPTNPTTQEATPIPRTKPDIVVFISDDMGWGDLSSYGAATPTPNIDKIANEGIRFTSAYTTAALCAPSRASFYTGWNPSNTGVKWNPPHELHGIIIAEVLRSLGYQTALFGKWHIEGYTPLEKGFDYAKWEFNGPVEADPGFDARSTRNAVEWYSNRDRTQPAFMVVSYHDPHTINGVPPAFALPNMTLYQNTVRWLDRNIGIVLDEIKRQDAERNTFVLFFSDNGPQKGYGSAGPYTGNKGSCREGGIRIPLLIRWPAEITPGRVSETPIILTDFFQTFINAANIDNRTLPDYNSDGVNLIPLLQGQIDSINGNGLGGGRELFFWGLPLIGNSHACAIRSGDIKYLREGAWNTNISLHNLKLDPTESVNCIIAPPEHPACAGLPEEPEDLAERLEEKIKEIDH
ncbi:sulfatase-like hydrolase/transferase [Candidatus Woesearchaeota archaeon]|nr:sulfatase-like hydrolase/transferase [Candidatus Woesearchaeota archaeon]